MDFVKRDLERRENAKLEGPGTDPHPGRFCLKTGRNYFLSRGLSVACADNGANACGKTSWAEHWVTR